ncbi:ankyrin repeat domain-containing protein [Halomonas sp. H33-56]|uniref:ankyrin repeat domain-containing protein n=1 Tax=Halomonas sp. H33-56 TaxID=2950873 RepID=UPI0032E04A17
MSDVSREPPNATATDLPPPGTAGSSGSSGNTFPSLEHPSIFLASPGDVAYLRRACRDEIETLHHQAADDHGLRLYAWEVDTAEDGFDDAVPAQQQIPHPSDPLCRGVICLFGEKVGSPLASHHPIDDLRVLDPMKPDDGGDIPGLVIPWDNAWADRGGFALTGSTFELLATLAYRERQRQEASAGSRPLPLLLCLVGPRDLLDTTEPLKAAWGNYRHFHECQDKCGTDSACITRRLEDRTQQLKQLINLVAFVQRRGHVIRVIDSQDAFIGELRRFMERDLNLALTASDRDPFKGLESYDVGDHALFCGRSDQRSTLREELKQRWNQQDRVPVVWVEGGSGSGKSSFLRAGIIGALVADSADHRCLDGILRPSDLAPDSRATDAASGDRCVLTMLFDAIVKRLEGAGWCDEPTASRARRLLGRTSTDLRIEALNEELCLLLDAAATRLARPPRLLLGFDQFEEIVDALYGEQQEAEFWDPLVQWLHAAHSCRALAPRLGIFVTLQGNRQELVERDSLLNELHATGQVTRMSFPPDNSLDEIIRKPFRLTGRLAISDALVARLKDNIQRIRGHHGRGDAQDSLLPLLSLALRNLYEHGLRLAEEATIADSASLGDAITTSFGRSGDRQADDDTQELGTSARAGFTESASGSEAFQTTGHLRTPDGGDRQREPPLWVLDTANAEGHDSIEGAITQLANEAFEQAKAASGALWSDSVVGDLLRRLVDWRQVGEKHFTLPATVFPAADATDAFQLARALRERRLLIDERHGRVRLVHEAVLHHWPQASEWLERERPVRECVRQLVGEAEHCLASPPDAARWNAYRLLYLDRAARVLAIWHDVLGEGPPTTKELARLREFCLTLLLLEADPAAVVTQSPRKPTHLILATFYQRADIIAAMVARRPEAVDLPRKDGRTATFWAVWKNRHDLLQPLLAAGADPDHTDEDHWRPVHLAAQAGAVDCLQRLVEAGASLDAQQAPHGQTPMHLAALAGQHRVLDYLIQQRGQSPDLTNANRQTPLEQAIANDRADTISHLIALGADPAAPHQTHWSYLHFAARGNHVKAAEALVAQGLEIDARLANDATPLHLAAYNDHPEIARWLIERGADLGALALAADWGKESSARERQDAWRKEGAKGVPSGKLGDFEHTPLHIAAARGATRVAELLLEHGADPAAAIGDGRTALHLAAEHGHPDTLALLCHTTATLDARDHREDTKAEQPIHQTALQASVTGGHVACAEVLLRAGSDPNTQLHWPGRSPFAGWNLVHLCADQGHAEPIRLLARHGADMQATTPDGRTALHLAALANRAEVVTALLDLGGVSVDVLDKHAMSALQLACLKGASEAAKVLLIGQGVIEQADIEQATEPGVATRESAKAPLAPTLLHLACVGGALDLVETLIMAGADCDASDAEGWHPLHLAVQFNHQTLVERLVAAGAEVDACAEQPGVTALQLAAEGGYKDIAIVLADAGADIDMATRDRDAPVLIALSLGQFPLALALIQRNADAAMRTRDGRSVAQVYAERLTRTCTRDDAGRALEDGPVADPRILAWLEGAGQSTAVIEKAVAALRAPAADGDQEQCAGTSPNDMDPDPAIARGALAPTLEGNPWQYPWRRCRPAFVESHWPCGSRIDGKHLADNRLVADACRLPWYPDATLIRLQHPDWMQGLALYFVEEGAAGVHAPRPLTRLTGTAPPIHELNARQPIQLCAANALGYLRFFCFFVRGPDGPFYIVDSLEDPLLPVHPDIQAIVAGSCHAPRQDPADDEDVYRYLATLYYADAFFLARFMLSDSGNIEMLDDEPIAAGLPERIHAPLD